MKRKKFKPYLIADLTLEKFVNGGQVLGYHDGKPVFVWGGIPGEKVDILVTKARKGILEGLVQTIKLKSKFRIGPKNEYEYLSTSPWQILDFDRENETKLNLLEQTFLHEAGIELEGLEMIPGSKECQYRNKMEYSFWGDEDGISLALHKRGTGQKIKLNGSILAPEAINHAGEDLVAALNSLDIFAGDLKSLVLRSSQDGSCVAALFVKKEDFPKLDLPKSLQGLVCYYSNPKSPASVITKELWRAGDIKLSDQVAETKIGYDVNSFFQVNVEMFELAIRDIRAYLGTLARPSTLSLTDLYGGVGSIGILLKEPSQSLKIVELSQESAFMAEENLKALNLSRAEVVCASAEESLSYITRESILVVDPPRAGLHKKVVQMITEVQPKILIYLSCNPVTQARDIKEIVQSGYKIKLSRGYNFFPRTPHIESLLVLESL